jgi:hypothetical protein
METQLKLANNDLSKKLDEKTNTIKDLSSQLSFHEVSFKEVKEEMLQVS